MLGILHNFRHEVRWCFTVSAVFQKRCLAAAFLLIYRQQQQSKLEIKILDKIGFLVGFQKGRFGLRGTCYCDRFCHFRHEIRWCFAVSAVFQKRCLAAAFLLIYRQQQQSKLEIKIGQNWISNRISEEAFRPPGDLLLRLMFSSILARNAVVFCCFGCVSKKVSGCWFLALLEAAAAVKIGDQNWTKLDF